MRRTKIVCTLGPASSGADALDRLVSAGMDVARINFSHGSPDEHAAAIRLIREREPRWGRPMAILQDLQGPKIRLGTFGPAGGGRVMPGAMPFLHRWLGNPMFTFLVRWWFNAPVRPLINACSIVSPLRKKADSNPTPSI